MYPQVHQWDGNELKASKLLGKAFYMVHDENSACAGYLRAKMSGNIGNCTIPPNWWYILGSDGVIAMAETENNF